MGIRISIYHAVRLTIKHHGGSISDSKDASFAICYAEDLTC
jgi:hypothetical protein